MTIKVTPVTKAAMDIFGAKASIRRGHALTNDEVIRELIRLADKDALDQAESTQSQMNEEIKRDRKT